MNHQNRSKSKTQIRRGEIVWAWLSLAALVIGWDHSMRLDEEVQAAVYSTGSR